MTLGEYLSLITNWHSTRPRYMNTVAVLIRPMVDAQAMLAKLTADFDLDTAVGVQLDMVGQWIGRDRYLRLPITGVFFAFDTINVGLDEGVWEGIWDATDKIVGLDDETYRELLKLQVIANHWDGTIPSIVEAFDKVYPGVVIDDRGDQPGGLMQMDVFIPSNWLSAISEAMLVQDFPIKPSGVRINIFKSTIQFDPMFGFDIDNATIGGFDNGAWAQLIYSA